jgi:low temperature requirement protein LtrA
MVDMGDSARGSAGSKRGGGAANRKETGAGGKGGGAGGKGGDSGSEGTQAGSRGAGSDQERPAPLIEPPRLRTGEKERSATRLELFFDLAYVLVVAELALTFSKDLTLHGAALFAGLFAVTWWSWVTMTLYANRFDTNDVIYRLAKLGGAAAAAGMAASAPEAVGTKATLFALAYLATRILLLALYGRAYRHVPDARTTIVIYLIGTGVSAALWAASLAVPGNARYVMWAVGVIVEALAPVVATRRGGGVPLHVEHLPERFGLFVILVLGESIASVVMGVHDTEWKPMSIAVALLAFLTVAALWWNYFDLGGAAGKRKLVDDGEDQESGVADAYVYGHLPLMLGLATVAVGIEQFILHPYTELATGARWSLIGGAALFFMGTAAVIVGTAGRLRAAWPWPIAAIPVVLGVGVLELHPLPTMGAIGAVLVAAVLTGMYEQRQGRLETTET